MSRRALTSGLVLFVGMVILNGCTINHYHGTASNPGAVDDSLLFIPELVAQQAIAQSSNTTDLKRSGTASPEEVLSMVAMGSGDDQSVQYMDSVGLEVQSNVDAYLNCYHKQADGGIIKVFPNRYARRYWVYATQRLTFPDEKNFKFLANSAGATEGFICLISEEDVLSKLPGIYQALMFQKLPVKSFEAVYTLYDQATERNLVAREVSYIIGK